MDSHCVIWEKYLIRWQRAFEGDEADLCGGGCACCLDKVEADTPAGGEGVGVGGVWMVRAATCRLRWSGDAGCIHAP